MSYDSAPGTLHFLGSEWAQVEGDIRCPAGSVLALLATGATAENVTADKYSGGGLRRCEHATQKELTEQFRPDPTLTPYQQPAALQDLSAPVWVSTALKTIVFAGAALVIVVALAGGMLAWRRRVRARREATT